MYAILSELAAQEITLEVIEPDPVSQPLPCPNQRVVYKCCILVPRVGLVWTVPTPGMPLEFSVASMIGAMRNTPDGKFTANLTGRVDDTDPNSDNAIFNSTLLVQPPLDSVSGSAIVCEGSGGNEVKGNITVTVSGEFNLHVL